MLDDNLFYCLVSKGQWHYRKVPELTVDRHFLILVFISSFFALMCTNILTKVVPSPKSIVGNSYLRVLRMHDTNSNSHKKSFLRLIGCRGMVNLPSACTQIDIFLHASGQYSSIVVVR